MILTMKAIQKIRDGCGANSLLQNVASLALTFVPHEGNHWLKKVIALLLVVTWLAMTLGIMAGWLVPTTEYFLLGSMCLLIVGRLWNVEHRLLFKGEK